MGCQAFVDKMLWEVAWVGKTKECQSEGFYMIYILSCFNWRFWTNNFQNLTSFL